MSNCGDIGTSNWQLDCDALPIVGMEDDVILMNRDDYLDGTITQTGNVVSAIVLGTGKQGIKGTMPDDFVQEVFNSEVGDIGISYFTHSLKVSLSDTPENRIIAENMAQGLIVAVAEMKAKGVDKEDAFVILGAEQGLKGTIEKDSAANGGMIVVTLASKDAREARAPLTFFITDYATTKAAFNALTVAAVTTTAA